MVSSDAAVTNGSSAQTVTIATHLSPSISIADYHNGISLFHALSIKNESGSDLGTVELSIVADPPVFAPRHWRIDSLQAEVEHAVHDLALRVDPRVLNGLTEREVAVLEFTLRSAGNEAILDTHTVNLTLLPRNHWSGLASHLPEVIAAFVQPNDPSIDHILKTAADILEAHGRMAYFNGYTDGSGHAWEVANAIWNAVSNLAFTYIYPPASFEESGQKIRTPDLMMQSRMGTCLDLTLLFAALLEQASLNPVIIFTKGHAFPGFWLQPKTLAARIEDDSSQMRNSIELKELVVFESTLVTNKERAIPFSEAIRLGSRNVSLERSDDFILAVDVKLARISGIHPLASLDAVASDQQGGDSDHAIELTMESVPTDILTEIRASETETVNSPEGRLDRWQRRLLDLSLRNRLLNFKTSRKTLRIELGSASQVEDAIATGKKLRFDPTPEMAVIRSDAEQARLEAITTIESSSEQLQRALDNRILLVKKTREDIDAALVALYRDTRLAQEEGGSNILFLAYGYLSWRPSKSPDRTYMAPLLLVPVVIDRTSARAGFTIQSHDDGPRFNPTLLQLLEQDYNLRLPITDDDLPQDSSGVDVEALWRKVRQGVEGIRGWEVIERVDLATFSFSKYLMWKDMADRAELLKKNLVVKQLLNGNNEGFPDQGEFPAEDLLDTSYSPDSVFAPLPADSSQLATVLAVSKGQSFVVIGPPGTGKSQTISNIIAQTLAEGKTVLFVSEKIAALDVVHRRLREIGLGDYCLELHSNKANKKGVLDQLGVAWKSSWNGDRQNSWSHHTRQLESLRHELNEYVSELHKIYPNNLSLYEALGRIARGKSCASITLGTPPSAMDTADAYTSWESAASRLQLHGSDLESGSLSNPALALVGAERWSLQFQSRAQAVARETSLQMNQAVQALSAFSHQIGLASETWSPSKIRRLTALAALLANIPDSPLPTAAQPGVEETLKRISVARQVAVALDAHDRVLEKWWAPPVTDLPGHPAIQQLHSTVSRLSVPYGDTLANFDLHQCIDEWRQANKKIFFLKGRAQSKVQQMLSSATLHNALPDADNDLPILETIAGLRDSVLSERDKLQSDLHSFADLATLAPDFWHGVHTNANHVEWAEHFATALERLLQLESVETHHTAREVIGEILEAGGIIKERTMALAIAVRSSVASLEELRKNLFNTLATHAATRTSFEERELQQQAALTESIGADGVDLRTWCSWQSARRAALETGLADLVNQVEAGKLPIDRVLDTFRANYAREWASVVSAQSPAIREFIGSIHERKIQNFRDLDKAYTEITAEIVRLRIQRNIPDPNLGGRASEAGILRRELEKKRRHKPIRRLMEEIPHLITGITPCFMMSPLSIAQYLSPDSDLFDVVVFDEASQIPVWDAVGAIARGKQVIMVGDQKQLPPTSFFDRAESDDDGEDDLQDLESILDECVSSSMPLRNLSWHYRSRHESLIAFSNRKYYNGDLITFPSPVTEDTAVSSRYVGGVYERGSTDGQKNTEEARAVVEEVVEHLQTHPDQSLGVVTFNMKQKLLIEELLDKERRNNPSLEQFFDTNQIEPVMVKNLENVQGDERDVMFFSTTFGRDAAGKMYMNFGPLTRTGGERRLNVAITRARRRLRIITSIRPEDIDLSRSSSRGVADFKVFLDYASRGVLALDAELQERGGESESPFEDSVANALRDKGWKVRQQIGVSGYRIDLAIVDPDAQGAYLCGLECDGATYHRTATARDRDQIRESVLRGLGWEILRVWSTDWFYNEQSVIENLHAKLERILDNRRAQRLMEEKAREAKSEETTLASTDNIVQSAGHADVPIAQELIAGNASTGGQASPATPSATSTKDTGTAFRYASKTKYPGSINPDQFYTDSYSNDLKEMISFIVSHEGPIREDDLIIRVRSWHGWGRAGNRIRQRILESLPTDISKVEEPDGTAFYWPPHLQTSGKIAFRPPVGAGNRRSAAEISLAELVGLAAALTERNRDNEVVLRMMSDAIGIERLASSARARLKTAIARSHAHQ